MSTRENILQTSLMLFLQKGYQGTSLQDIAQIVGIKKPSIYNHFNSKEKLGEAVLQSLLHEEVPEELFQQEPWDMLSHLLLMGSGVHDQSERNLHSRESLVIELLHFFPQYRQECFDFLMKLQSRLQRYWEEKKSEGLVHPDCPCTAITWQILSIPHGMVLNQMASKPFDTRPMLEAIRNALWDQIRPDSLRAPR